MKLFAYLTPLSMREAAAVYGPKHLPSLKGRYLGLDGPLRSPVKLIRLVVVFLIAAAGFRVLTVCVTCVVVTGVVGTGFDAVFAFPPCSREKESAAAAASTKPTATRITSRSLTPIDQRRVEAAPRGGLGLAASITVCGSGEPCTAVGEVVGDGSITVPRSCGEDSSRSALRKADASSLALE